MANSFGLIAPCAYGFAVTPSDSTEYAEETRAVYVGTTGDLAVKQYDPTTKKLASVTYQNVPAGTILPIRTKTIMSTGTSASDLVGML